jgi:hypothetical protein
VATRDFLEAFGRTYAASPRPAESSPA